MATLELDPIFVKALRLLHSKAKDSAAQLRSMVDDAIASRKIKVFSFNISNSKFGTELMSYAGAHKPTGFR